MQKPAPPETPNDIDALFVSSGLSLRLSALETVKHLASLMACGDIAVTIDCVAEAYTDLPDALERQWHHAGESKAHLLLKLNAANWLLESGADWICPEYRIAPYKVDVFAGGVNWVSECGDTTVGKCLDLLMMDSYEKFVLVPFRRSPDTPGLFAYEFTSTDDARERFADARLESLREAAKALE